MTTASVFDTFRGLPLHVLVIHATVVLVPLVLLALLAVAAVPRWRARFTPHVAGAALLLVPLVGLTVLSGRQFRDRLGVADNPAVQRHATLGDHLFWWTVAVAVASGVLALLVRRSARRGPGLAVNALATVVVVLTVVAMVQVARTGEAGSTAVWQQIVQSTSR